MKVVVPSHGRPEVQRTVAWLTSEGDPRQHAGVEEVLVVVDTAEEARAYERAGQCARAGVRVVVADPVEPPYRSITQARRWAEAALVRPGEWYVSFDDNVRGMTALPVPLYWTPGLPVQTGEAATWRRLYGTPVGPGEFFGRVMRDTLAHAGTVGARLAGFAVVDNYFFRGRKFREVGFVCGKVFAAVARPDGWEPRLKVKEDYDRTARALYEDGRVVVNNYAAPVMRHYEAGGCGNWAARLDRNRTAARVLVQRWPDLFRVKGRNGDAGCEVQLRFTRPEQVAEWRRRWWGQLPREARGNGATQG